MVVEQDKNSYYQNPFYLLPAIASSEWTSSVSGSYIFAPYCRGIVHPATEEDADISYTDLLTSSATSFAKARTWRIWHLMTKRMAMWTDRL